MQYWCQVRQGEKVPNETCAFRQSVDSIGFSGLGWKGEIVNGKRFAGYGSENSKY